MSVRCHTLFLIAGLVLGGVQLDANRVSAPRMRADLLEAVRALLDDEPGEFAPMPGGRSNPFAAPVEAVAPADAAAGEAPQAVRRLSDEQALAAIAREFQPSGSLIAGDRALLRLSDGSSLREGEGFTARIQGQSFRVVVSEIDVDGYTLVLGEAAIRRGFSSAGGAVRSSGTPPDPNASR